VKKYRSQAFPDIEESRLGLRKSIERAKGRSGASDRRIRRIGEGTTQRLRS
jgi:hypothetical protein